MRQCCGEEGGVGGSGWRWWSRSLVGCDDDSKGDIGIRTRGLFEKESAVFIQCSSERRQRGVGTEKDVDAFNCDGVGASNVGNKKVAAVERWVQVLNASVDGTPPKAEIDTPVTAVPGTMMKKGRGKCAVF